MVHYTKELKDELDLHECATIKKKKNGRGDPTIKTKTGDSFFKKTQEWTNRDMTVNRENDTYDEVTKNSKGEVIHECHEPLSKHKGHGSDKKK